LLLQKAEEGNKMLILTDVNFEEEVLKSNLPVLVDFFATWCGPCKMMGPIVEELAKELEGKVKVVEVDVDKAPQSAEKYAIMSVPTLILFKNGQVVKQMVGFQSKADLVKEITFSNT